MKNSEDVGRLLYETYTAGPGGDRPVPEKFIELLCKLEAQKAEEEKKQNG